MYYKKKFPHFHPKSLIRMLICWFACIDDTLSVGLSLSVEVRKFSSELIQNLPWIYTKIDCDVHKLL